MGLIYNVFVHKSIGNPKITISRPPFLSRSIINLVMIHLKPPGWMICGQVSINFISSLEPNCTMVSSTSSHQAIGIKYTMALKEQEIYSTFVKAEHNALDTGPTQWSGIWQYCKGQNKAAYYVAGQLVNEFGFLREGQKPFQHINFPTFLHHEIIKLLLSGKKNVRRFQFCGFEWESGNESRNDEIDDPMSNLLRKSVRIDDISRYTMKIFAPSGKREFEVIMCDTWKEYHFVGCVKFEEGLNLMPFLSPFQSGLWIGLVAFILVLARIAGECILRNA